MENSFLLSSSRNSEAGPWQNTQVAPAIDSRRPEKMRSTGRVGISLRFMVVVFGFLLRYVNRIAVYVAFDKTKLRCFDLFSIGIDEVGGFIGIVENAGRGDCGVARYERDEIPHDGGVDILSLLLDYPLAARLGYLECRVEKSNGFGIVSDAPTFRRLGLDGETTFV